MAASFVSNCSKNGPEALSDALIVKDVGNISLENDSVARGLGAEIIGHLAETSPKRDGWSFMITSDTRLVANVPFTRSN